MSCEALFQNSQIEKKFTELLKNPEIKVVSFDIFDTIFFRKCGEAKNVFETMGEHSEVQAIFDIPSTFNNYRQNAEKVARRIHSYKEDITLCEIYDQLPLTTEEKKRFQEIELATEKEMLVVNLQLEHWIDFALEAGKKVILLSDMYLSSEQVATVAVSKLSSKEKITKIYMSNEHNATKATGSLFLHAIKELQIEPHELLHIGDNERSDIAIAQNFGIKTLYYGQNKAQKQRAKHEKLYTKEEFQSACHVRILTSLLNPYTNDLQKFYHDIASSVFAPILWEFSHWLANISQKHQREKLSFIMREGALFEKCFKMLYPQIETNLLYASRKSTNFLTLSADDIGSANFAMYKNFTLQELYASFFLEIQDARLLPYQQLLCHELQGTFLEYSNLLLLVIQDMTNQKTKIQNALNIQKEYLAHYLEELKINTETSLIDFGGSGTIIKRLVAFLPKDLRPSTNILLYQHAGGYAKLLEEHVLSFLPFTEKTAHAIESIHRTPEFIEILLNGICETTYGYTKQGTKTTPQTYMPNANKHTIHEITQAFEKGIELFFALAKSYNLPAKSFERDKLTLLLARLIELPTEQESQFFGALEYDEGKASEHIYKLIDQQKLNYLQIQGIEKTHQEFLNNPIKHRTDIPWMEGTITQLSPNYLAQFYGQSTHPNQEIIETLLEKIDRVQLKKLMVYGAGELFAQLLPHLQERKIQIEAVIDTRAEVKPFEFEGYNVVSLSQALQEKEKATIVVASGVYSTAIQDKIIRFAQEHQKQLVCIGSDL
jgi:HAD superfamily hydrolase (TIGR01549 family)